MKTEQPTKEKKRKFKCGLKFDLADDKETKVLVGYMKWWLYEHPVNEEKLN